MVGHDKGKERPLSDSAIAGAIAGILTRFFAQPLDVIKIRFQLQVEPIVRTSKISKYKALAQATQVVWKEEGLRAFWSGHNAGQLLSIAYGISNFATFEYLTKQSDILFSTGRHPLAHFACGFASGSVATIVSYPFDTMRTRFVVQGTKLHSLSQTHYRNMVNGFSKMVRKEGLRAPFKGLFPSLLQGASLAGVNFLVHNIVSKFIGKFRFLNNGVNLNLSGNLFAGSVAGFCSKLVVYPLDLARKRMQFQGFQDARIGFGENFTCRGLINCLSRTYSVEGLQGLFKGLSPSLIKAVVTTALHFTFYQETINFLSNFN